MQYRNSMYCCMIYHIYHTTATATMPCHATTDPFLPGTWYFLFFCFSRLDESVPFFLCSKNSPKFLEKVLSPSPRKIS